ncbi:aldose 1-epimerase family protein [Facklamia languida]
MVTIENQYLTVQISERGAEIQSVSDRKTDYEFIWQNESKQWESKAPVLFPIVSQLKEDRYHFQGKTYAMRLNGFAQEMDFTLQQQTDSSATFYLKSSPDTRAIYPFDFSFQITYVLFGNQLTVSYEVLNPSRDQPLYYSIGAQPCFRISQSNVKPTYEFDRVSLAVDPSGPYYEWPVLADGLVDPLRAKYREFSQIPLLHRTFKRGPMIIQVNERTAMILKDGHHRAQVTVKLSGFPYAAIWSPYPTRLPFVSIQPWAGLPDTIDTDQDLSHKKSILLLAPQTMNMHDFTIKFEKQ